MRSSAVRILALAVLAATSACSSSSKLTADSTTSVEATSPPTVVIIDTTAPSGSTSTVPAPTSTADTVPATAAPPTTTPPTAAPTTTAAPPTTPAATSPTTPATAAPTTGPATTIPPDTAVGPDPTEPAAPGLAPCATSALKLSLGDTGAAAGNQYTPIIFTNAGSVTCTLDGHPGVSFTDDAGTQIGASAERVPGSTPTVTLHVGEQAHATMDYHDPGFFDDCHPQPATMLKVYPPDEYDALTIAFPERVCTTAIAEAEITIDVVKPGIELP